MSLKERLLQDMKDALREKDTVRKDVVQIVRAGVLQVEKDQKIVLDDAGVIDVIAREVKKRYDVLPDYERSGRDDLIAGINRQIEILKGYLPVQLTESEVEAVVNETMAEIGASGKKDMGRLMQALSPKVKGRADGKLVSEIVKAKLFN